LRVSSLKKPKHYELRKLYWKDGKSLYQIARLYGVCYDTVWKWMKKHDIARRDVRTALKLALSSPEVRRKMSISHRRKFVFRPIPASAYVLGVLLGDGYVCKSKPNDCIVGLAVKDRVFAEKFKTALKKIGLGPYDIYTDSKETHRVRARSAEFYEWYNSLDLKKISSLIEGFEDRFVRGLYESEGCINVHESESMRIHIGNKNKQLLSMVQNIITSWGIPSGLYGPRKDGCSILQIYGDEHVKKFLCIVKPCIKTKPRTGLGRRGLGLKEFCARN
jgi:intein-encoded DNA endonuclease-like protein